MVDQPAPVILLMGATATGKTDLAVRMAERFPVELISVDSALIYRDMDIGTAKPGPDVLQRAPHHLIDIIDPADSYSAWDFVTQTIALIADIRARGRIPLLVGGTMMYFNSLQQGMHNLPMADDELRKTLNRRLREEGLEALQHELAQVDPAMAQRLKPTDTQRILRALEVYLTSGVPMSELQQREPQRPDLEFSEVILDVPDRVALHRRIEQRFNLMLEQDFEQEVRGLHQRGDLNLEMPSMRCVGYRQMWLYLDGELGHQEMVEKSVIATRQLAKRQLTWLRKFKNALYVNYGKYKDSEIFQYLNLS
jgi:tRNA dimethylallyltransferase